MILLRLASLRRNTPPMSKKRDIPLPGNFSSYLHTMSHVCTVLPIVIVSVNCAAVFALAALGIEKFVIPLILLFISVVVCLLLIFIAYAKLIEYLDKIVSKEEYKRHNLNYIYINMLQKFFILHKWSLYASIFFFASAGLIFLCIERGLL
jgi:hypothetical protein